MTNDTMIRARSLGKTFSSKGTAFHAVEGLNLDVSRGELFAFLGPNGAGKSTTLRMLSTLLPPDEGEAIVAGFDVVTQPAQVRRRIGYIGQGTSGGHNQRVRDELLSQGAFYGMGRAATRTRADELMHDLQLDSLADRTIGKLSGGQKRRLDVALGLIHSPDLLFLDEPSTGLDPQSRANLWQHIRRLRDDHGTTIFFTTHYLDEADSFAERVVVMDRGTVIADDTASDLKSTLAGDVITLGFGSETDAAAAAGTAARVVESKSIDRTGTTVEVTVHRGDRALPQLLVALTSEDVRVETATLRQPTLDDVFLKLTGRSLRDSAVSTDSVPTGEKVPA